MATLTFDTLKFARRLKEAGVPEQQAEAEAEVLSETLEVNLKDLVTQSDLAHEADLLRRDLRELEQRLLIKLGALMAFGIGIVATLVRRL